jgi:predicted Zn-dependent peptidase
MATLRIDADAFDREREVVKEERRMRVENQPYGRLSEIITEHAFTTHPYRHAPIGSMADLEAASIGDVRDFHNLYYVPENATLTIVGDIDSAQALQLVTQYFGRVPKAARPVPRDVAKEPAQTAERRFTITESWPLPAVVVAYHIVYDGHADSYPLHILSKILSDGDSARVPRELVYEQRLALTASATGNILEDPSLFYGLAIVQPGQTPEAAEKALTAEFEKLKTAPVTERELDRAKNQFARDYVLGRESVEDKASQLAHAAVIHNDITTADGEFDIFLNVTREDLQRVARTYFTESNRTVLYVLPPQTSGGRR